MSFWHKLKNTIKSPTFIKEVYGESTGQAFKYLILMFTLVFLIVAIPVTVKSMQNVPDFKLENGQLQFFGPQPYIKENNGVVVIIDSTGKTRQSDLNKYDNGFLITKTQLHEKVGQNTQVIDFAPLKGAILDKKIVQLMILLFLIPAYIIYFGSKMLGILIFALVAMAMAHRKELFPFNKALIVAIYASTLATFVQGMFMLAPSVIPFLPTFAYIMFVIWYQTVAIRAIENETTV